MSKNPFNLENKTAIITGGASGIGAATTELFASVGAKVYVSDIDLDACQLRHRNSAFADNISVHHCDVADNNSVNTFVSAVLSEGPVDILFNNAGAGLVGTLPQTSEEDFDRLYNVNVKGVYRLSNALMPHFLERKSGNIVNMASICGVIGVPDRAAYCMSKFAIVGMTKAMALEFAPNNIRVNSIGPTFIETPLARVSLQDPEMNAYIMSKIKLGRIGQVEDLMGAIVFLSSDAAAMITGAALLIDGGWTIG